MKFTHNFDLLGEQSIDGMLLLVHGYISRLAIESDTLWRNTIEKLQGGRIGSGIHEPLRRSTCRRIFVARRLVDDGFGDRLNGAGRQRSVRLRNIRNDHKCVYIVVDLRLCVIMAKHEIVGHLDKLAVDIPKSVYRTGIVFDEVEIRLCQNNVVHHFYRIRNERIRYGGIVLQQSQVAVQFT